MIELVNSASIIYTWAVVCILVFFLFAIARFYEQKSGRRSYYQFFIIPIGLFAIAALKYAIPPGRNIIGDFWGDGLRFIAGLILGVAGFLLLKLMMGGRS